MVNIQKHSCAAATFSNSDFLNRIPEVIFLEVLRFLNPIELTKCSEVNRKWEKLSKHPALWNSFDLKTLFPSLKVI
jgi:hypothetical protein